MGSNIQTKMKVSKITFISDTHSLHYLITNDLPGGDILIHTGDVMNSGKYQYELEKFLEWFSNVKGYKHKIFIAGNHDILFEDFPIVAKEIFTQYPNVTYLQDSSINIEGLKIYGSPWQPEFCDWAFNLPRGEKLKAVWDLIPNDTDILVTHGPPMDFLDMVIGQYEHLGCYDLKQKVLSVQPKIHCFGHIHSGAGETEFNDIKFINASVLDESYQYINKPINIEL